MTDSRIAAAPSAPTGDEREAFEAWAREQVGMPWAIGDGVAWAAWQARASSGAGAVDAGGARKAAEAIAAWNTRAPLDAIEIGRAMGLREAAEACERSTGRDPDDVAEEIRNLAPALDGEAI